MWYEGGSSSVSVVNEEDGSRTRWKGVAPLMLRRRKMPAPRSCASFTTGAFEVGNLGQPDERLIDRGWFRTGDFGIPESLSKPAVERVERLGRMALGDLGTPSLLKK